MAKSVLPRVQAMVVCDALKETDEASVYHLSGVRAVLDVMSFPAFQPRLCIFLHMSGHLGQANCRVQIERAGTAELIYESVPKLIAFHEPTVVESVFFRLRNCVFSGARIILRSGSS
jgi:hypothetical protein